MLGSFHLYPTASLLTELVQIFQGKYIVKASLQIEGVTRVTGMAAAEILEDAEDRARVRVITIFGEVPNIQPQPTVVEVPKPDVAAAISMDTSSRILEPVAATAVQQTEPTLSVVNVAIGTSKSEKEVAPVTEAVQVLSSQPDVVASITVIEKEVAPVTEAVQVLSSQPEVVAPITVIEKEVAPVTEPIQVLLPKSEVAAITDEHSVPTPSEAQPEEVVAQASNVINATKTRNARLSEVTLQETIAFDSTPEVNIAPPINQEISQVPATIKPSPIPEPILVRPLEIATETQTELPLTAVAPPSNVTPFVPRNYNPPTEIGIPNDVPSTGLTTTKRTKKMTQPKDNSDDIAKIAVEMERLRWTIEQGRDYLFETYGKKSRHSLSDEDLRDFREYLESQPTPTDDPLAIDPIAGF